jgi:hypothetical protein
MPRKSKDDELIDHSFTFSKNTEEFKFLQGLFENNEISASDSASSLREQYAHMFAKIPKNNFRSQLTKLRNRYGVTVRETDDNNKNPTIAEAVGAATGKPAFLTEEKSVPPPNFTAIQQVANATAKDFPPMPPLPSLVSEPKASSEAAPASVEEEEEKKLPAQNWQPIFQQNEHVNGMEEGTKTIITSFIPLSGIKSGFDMKVEMCPGEDSKVMVQQLVNNDFSEPSILIKAYMDQNQKKNLGFAKFTAMGVQTRFQSFMAACQKFCGGGKKKNVWATTYFKLPFPCKRIPIHMNLIKKDHLFVYVFEFAATELNEWNLTNRIENWVDIA